MFRKLSTLTFILSLLATLSLPVRGENAFGAPWPLLPNSVQAKEGEKWGELPNGLRYVIVPTDAPASAVSMRLLVAAGKAQEIEGKSGVAQIVSKMAFQGTKSFDRQKIVRFQLAHGINPQTERLADVELDYTNFRVDIEEPEQGGLKEGLSILGEIATAIDFDAETFERVRSDLVHKTKYGPAYFESDQSRVEKTLLRSSTYSSPGATDLAEQLNAISLSDVQSYWNRWYKANRMVVVVIGVVDSQQVETELKEVFGGVSKSENLVGMRDALGSFRNSGNLDTGEPDGPYAALAVSYVDQGQNLFDPKAEAAYYAKDLVGRYAQSISSGNKELGGSILEILGNAVALSIQQRGSVRQLLEQLLAVDKVIYRLQEFGIRDQDLRPAKASYLKLRYSYDPVLSTKGWPRLLADRVVGCIVDGLPFRYGSSFESYLEGVITPLDADEVKELCSRIFAQKNLAYYVELPKGFGLSSKAINKKLKAVRKSYDFTWERAGELEKPMEFQAAFPTAGIVKSTEILRFDEYPVLQYEFANNLRLNLIRTDEFGSRIFANVSLGNGTSELKNQGRAFEILARAIMQKARLGSGAQAPLLKDALKSKGVSNLEVEVDLDQLSWKAESNDPSGIAEFFSGLVFWLVTGDFAEKTFDDELEKMQDAAGRDMGFGDTIKIDESLFGSDLRMQEYFVEEDLEGLDYTGLRNWIKKTREESYIEVTVVGDVVPRTILRDVRNTFGSAPVRTGKVMQPRHGDPVEWKDPGIVDGVMERPSENGYVTLLFPQVEESSCLGNKRLDVLRPLLEMHIREELKESPMLEDTLSVTVVSKDMIPQSGALKVQVRSPKGEIDDAKESLLAAAASFSESLTPGILEAAERNAWIELKRLPRDGGKLISLFSQSQGKPNVLRCVLGFLENGISDTLENYKDIASQQFTPENVRGVVLSPKE